MNHSSAETAKIKPPLAESPDIQGITEVGQNCLEVKHAIRGIFSSIGV